MPQYNGPTYGYNPYYNTYLPQPTGAHDAYHVGDKITYNGKHYTCVLDGCVWAPDAYPQGWREEA